MSAIESTKSDPGSASAAIALAKEAAGSISAFANESNFIAAQRMAKALSVSSLVPAAYQNNVPNTLIAMELAARVGMSVFMVMQSLDVIHGRPSWSSKFLIASVNASGQFTKLRFRWEGTPGKDDWGCRAVARDKADKEECIGPLVTIGTAKAEGWYAKNGSKWKTLPELMLMYRSAGFWTRVYCPEISLGMQTSEEVIDTTGYSVVAMETNATRGDTAALEAKLLGTEQAPIASPSAPSTTQRETDFDPETGEVEDAEELNNG